MPISSPSYFPPQRSDGSVVGTTAGAGFTGDRSLLSGQGAGDHIAAGIDDLIVIGDHALDAGLTDTNQSGAIVIGSSAASALTNGSGTTPRDGNIVVGFNAIKNIVIASSNIVVGTNCGATMTGGDLNKNVILGNETFAPLNFQGQHELNVIIGYNTAINRGRFRQSVLIGSNVISTGSNLNCDIISSVVIGQGAGAQYGLNDDGSGFNQQSVIIGNNCASVSSLDRSVVLGANTQVGLAGAFRDACTVIGADSSAGASSAGSRIVSYGYGVNLGTGNNNLFLGYKCNSPAGGNYTNALLIEGNIDVTSAQRALVFGDFAAGNILLGNSVEGVNRLWGTGPTNILKLLNGSVGDATTRGGGGYFYVSAGALHWVGSAGTDTVIAAA